MKDTTSPFFVVTATLLILTHTSVSTARAASSLVTSVGIGASNNPDSFPTFEPGGSGYSGTGALVTGYGTSSFTGLNRNNEEATMTFSGTATASASYGMLRTAASGSVSGVYFNEANIPYDDPETGVNPSGSPTFLVSYGQAQFNDTLNYGTIPAGFTTDFWFHISGSFTGANVYHSVLVEFGTQSSHIVLYPVDGANHIWTTNKFVPLPGVDTNFTTTVISSFTFSPEFGSEGASYSGSADFMNTVTLAGINVYDGSDNLVSGWSPSSGSGTTYPVPEPSAALLGLAGVAGLLVHRRRG